MFQQAGWSHQADVRCVDIVGCGRGLEIDILRYDKLDSRVETTISWAVEFVIYPNHSVTFTITEIIYTVRLNTCQESLGFRALKNAV